MQEAFQAIRNFLLNNDGFTILCHASPDGDTLGSGLALFIALKNQGKKVEISCHDTVPSAYDCMPYTDCIILPQAAVGYENVIAVDCADAARMGNGLPLFQKGVHTLNIDHHTTNTRYAQINIVDPSAAAASELMTRVLRETGLEIDRRIATCLYVGMMTDTGSFAYANTTPNTMRAAADMMAKGIEHNALNTSVFRNVPVEKKRLLGMALTNMTLFAQGRGAITQISMEEIRRVGAMEEYTEGIIDHLRDIDTVEVAIMVRESEEGTKVSMRSKGAVDVAQIAAQQNGGGHVRAAGYTVQCGMEEASKGAQRMVEACLKGS